MAGIQQTSIIITDFSSLSEEDNYYLEDEQFIMTDFLLPEESRVTDIITRNVRELYRWYSTLQDHYEDVCIDRPSGFVAKTLYIVYLKQGKQYVDIFYRKKIYGKFDDPYRLCHTGTLAYTISKILSTVDEDDDAFIWTCDVNEETMYGLFLNRFMKRYQNWLRRVRIRRKLKPRFITWLEKAREKIVARESHPDRVNELLESGVDLDDVGNIIDSKLAVKLSW